MAVFSGFKNGVLTLDPGTTGDSTIQFNRATLSKWIDGVDISEANRFVIAQGSALGITDAWRMTTTGQRTMPDQPSFLAIGALEANAWGQDVYSYLGAVVPMTTIINRGGFFTPGNGAGIGAEFIAPITGLYVISLFIDSTDTKVHGAGDRLKDHTYYLITTSYTYTFIYEPEQADTLILNYPCARCGAVVAPLTAGDSCRFALRNWNGGAVMLRDIIASWVCGSLIA